MQVPPAPQVMAEKAGNQLVDLRLDDRELCAAAIASLFQEGVLLRRFPATEVRRNPCARWLKVPTSTGYTWRREGCDRRAARRPRKIIEQVSAAEANALGGRGADVRAAGLSMPEFLEFFGRTRAVEEAAPVPALPDAREAQAPKAKAATRTPLAPFSSAKRRAPEPALAGGHAPEFRINKKAAINGRFEKHSIPEPGRLCAGATPDVAGPTPGDRLMAGLFGGLLRSDAAQAFQTPPRSARLADKVGLDQTSVKLAMSVEAVSQAPANMRRLAKAGHSSVEVLPHEGITA